MTASAICAIACGIAYGKAGALDIMELSLKDVGKQQNVGYYCVGNDAHATCYFKDIDSVLFGVRNLRADMWLTDNQVKQEISGDIDTGLFVGDYEKFAPKSFKCESKQTLQDTQSTDIGNCIVKSDVATLSLDSKALMESKSFRYKTMPSIVLQYIAQVEQFSKEYERIQTEHNNEIDSLLKQTKDEKENIQYQINALKIAIKRMDRCCDCNVTVGQFEEINSEIASKNGEMDRIVKKFDTSYDEIQKRYEEGMQDFTQSIVSWLKQYNYTLQEARIYLNGNKLGEEAFTTFARDYFDFNENVPLTRQQKQERSEYKKRITAQYYSGLEAIRAAGMTFIEQSPYLDKHLRDSLQNVVAENAKLFDSHSNKKSLRILITPIRQDAINLGDEAQKLITAYNKDKSGNGDEMLHAIFNIINKYDIRAVKWWPN